VGWSRRWDDDQAEQAIKSTLERRVQSTMLTELLAFRDELLAYLESVRDVRGEDGRPVRRSPELERLTRKTRGLRDAVSAELQKY